MDFDRFYTHCSANHATKSKVFAQKFNVDLVYGSYKELALDPNIDAIYIATPHSFHKAHTILCLNQHKPVLCEKPFAMNLKEVEEMIQLSKQNKTLLMEAMWTIFLPHYQYVLELIKNRHYGEILKLEADFGWVPQKEGQKKFSKKHHM